MRSPEIMDIGLFKNFLLAGLFMSIKLITIEITAMLWPS
jgi:hypothetical protein